MHKLLSVLRAAGEITRLRILSILSNSELTVSELVEILDQSQPRVSRHLKLLCDSGLLERYQEGTRVFHRIADAGEAANTAKGLLNLIDFSDQTLREDHRRLKEIKARNAELAAQYFSTIAQEWDTARNRMVADGDVETKLIQSLNTQHRNLLIDLGTGTGRMLQIFSPYIERGIGIDLNREMLLVARSNLDTATVTNCTVRQGDIRQLHLEAHTADIVIIHQVLHYLDDPDKVIKEAERILKPQGQLLIVDFLPHDMEFLREQHAHRRLGISNVSLEHWCRRFDLVHHLQLPSPGYRQTETLTVGLWDFKKQ